MQKHSTLLHSCFFLLTISLILCISPFNVKAQLTNRVLFLGNSYTYVNDLPQLTHDVALSAGDTLVFDSYTVGGYRLVDHYNDPNSQNKIMAGGWEYVVIQGQSQEPVVATSDFLYGGSALYSVIETYNPCAVTMPYMTWGRKNGDASYCASIPVMCTYEGMDSTLKKQYLNLTSNINGEVSPVSVVWHYIRQNYPGIELYDADESHPSPAGTYAAACSFYASIFKKDPTLITFDFGLNPTDAADIRNAAKTQVFDQLSVWDYKKQPFAGIVYEAGATNNELIFHAVNAGVRQTYLWNFGDGDTSSSPYAPHTYLNDGTYTVTLTATNCDLQGTYSVTADTVIQLCSHTPTVYATHPQVCEYDTLWTQPADAYQWYVYGTAIPETNQYLPDYSRYGYGASVMSTINGCSELSYYFAANPVWSGYYFDGIGNPCLGDTVVFAVLHINGALPGTETILWYKNDTLLPAMTNEDTLLITSEGKYDCKVFDPSTICPYDTTVSTLEYNCGVSGIVENNNNLSWTLYPNPAVETITVKFTEGNPHETIQIFNASGKFVKSVRITTSSAVVNINDLADGMYFMLTDSRKYAPLKFIRQ